MNATQKIVYLLVGLVGGFLIGFAFANGVNRRGQEISGAAAARAGSINAQQSGRAGGSPTDAGGQRAGDDSSTTLTEEELRQAVARGDARPTDIELQRNLGRGLYLYAMNTRNAAILPDAVRMLRRAYEADPRHYETIVLLAEALFDAGQHGDPEQIAEARRLFTAALEMRPDDVNVRTELGITYFLANPSDPQRAIREYRKSLARNPRHEMTLQSLATALIATGEMGEAKRRVDELQQQNSSHPALPNLREQLARGPNASKERD